MNQHDLDPLPEEIAELLAAERARPGVSPSARTRVAARLGASLGTIVVGVAADASAATASSATGAATTLGAATTSIAPGKGIEVAGALLTALSKPVGIGLVVTALGAGAVGAYVSRSNPGDTHTVAPQGREAASSSVTPSSEVTATPTGGGTPTPTPEVAQTPEPPSPQGAPASSSRAARSAHPLAALAGTGSSASSAAPTPRDTADHELAAERVLLETARADVAKGQSSSALQRLAEHARDFPRGRLAEEREALRIRALLAAGQSDEARSQAARFKKSFPRSLVLPTLEDALGPIP